LDIARALAVGRGHLNAMRGHAQVFPIFAAQKYPSLETFFGFPNFPTVPVKGGI
jgi:hypothetical protein